MNHKKDTSWEKSAEWYDRLLKDEDTYQSKVILPNLLRMLELKKADRVLDLACGQGYFTQHFIKEAGKVVGADLSRTLIEIARKRAPGAVFHEADAGKLLFAKDKSFDAVICVLGIQNMENLQKVFSETARVLKDTGRFLFVLNHPTFRIPKKSAWGYDEALNVQFRRVDQYLSSAKVQIEMHPGQQGSETTWSFHRSLQDYMKTLRNTGFAITRLEEWISHKKSEKGPRAKAEDIARKEIPLFLAVEVRLLNISID